MLSSATNLLSQAWKIYKKKFWVFLVIMIIPLFAPSLIVSILFPFRIRTEHFSIESLNGLSLGLLAFVGILVLVSIFIHLWSQVALLCAVKDKDIGIKESYRRGWGKLMSYFWIFVLSDFIIVGGFFLFFVPGLIFLVWFIFAPFILIVENKRGLASLLASKEYVKGNWRAVFWRFLVFGVLACLILLAISIITGIIGIGNTDKIQLYAGYILLNPLGIIYLFLIYDNLKKLKVGGSIRKESE